MMKLISHRINTIEQLCGLPEDVGVEVDLRDSQDGRIYLQHDPFTLGDDFEEYLKEYQKQKEQILILNIKSERIEYKILELLNTYKIDNYFFLDSSFPMIKTLSDLGENRLALRYSEWEGMDTLQLMQGKVNWVWADCFEGLALTKKSYEMLKNMGYLVCMVSPELQGRPEQVDEYINEFIREGIYPDAVCTKTYCMEKWKRMEGQGVNS